MHEASPSPTPTFDSTTSTDSTCFQDIVSDSQPVHNTSFFSRPSDSDPAYPLATKVQETQQHLPAINTRPNTALQVLGLDDTSVSSEASQAAEMDLTWTNDVPVASDTAAPAQHKNNNGFTTHDQPGKTYGHTPHSSTGGSLAPSSNDVSMYTTAAQTLNRTLFGTNHQSQYRPAPNQSTHAGQSEAGPSSFNDKQQPGPGGLTPSIDRQATVPQVFAQPSQLHTFPPSDAAVPPIPIRKARKGPKSRSSMASTSSVGDGNGAGTSLSGIGSFGSSAYGLPLSGGDVRSTGMLSQSTLGYSSQASLVPTPSGSNDDSEGCTSNWPVVSPPAISLGDLPLLVHGVKRKGAKSRVETQIKMRVSIVRPASAFGPRQIGTSLDSNTEETLSNNHFEKIGTYKAVKIKAGMGARRRVRKNAGQTDPDSLGSFQPEEVLFLYTEVWCTDRPSRAYACAKCVNRERKRAQARSSTASSKAKTALPSESDDFGSKSNVNAAKPEESVDEDGLTQADRERILLFNCGPLVELQDGECDLPARLTCYCRHHKEKTGFR